jgi:hypothetical protein
MCLPDTKMRRNVIYCVAVLMARDRWGKVDAYTCCKAEPQGTLFLHENLYPLNVNGEKSRACKKKN